MNVTVKFYADMYSNFLIDGGLKGTYYNCHKRKKKKKKKRTYH